MRQVVRRFFDGSFLEYDRGSFDDWCVYLTDASGHRKPPRDEEYFSQLESLAQQFGADKVYGDYVKVYQRTRSQIDERVLDDIHILSETYGTDALRVEKLFSILYMAMISEENKANTRLGKRIKRLGVHKLLIENQPVYEAANFMRGMDWRTIDRLCAERNF